MKKKIVGIFVLTLLITTAVLPAVETTNIKMCQINDTLNQPIVEWEKTFGGDEFDNFIIARQTSDGGYIACGITEESDMYYVRVLKVDSNGNQVWSKTNYDLNGTIVTNTINWVYASDVIETSDHGFLIIGYSVIPYEYNGDTYWIGAGFFWKTDDEGITEWVQHYYEVNVNDLSVDMFEIYNVIEVDDSFIGGGCKEWYEYNATDSFVNGAIMKTDLSGNLLWSNEFDKTDLDFLSSVYQTSDGGYYLGGFVEGSEYQGNDALRMVKTDANGTLEWEKIFDGPKFEYTFGKGFYQTSDGGYIMDGVTMSYGHGNTDAWLIKADSSGNEMWNKTYGGKYNDYSWAMCKADNNGFALGVCLNYTYAGGNKDDIYIVETDENGNTEWEFQLEEAGSQVTRSINPTNDGGYIIGAMSSPTFGNAQCDGILVKLASFDNQQSSKPTISGKHKGKPNTNYTFTASSTDPDSDTLSYMWDWGDGNYSEWLTTPTATYNWASKDKFEIKVIAKDQHGYESEWSDPFSFSIPRNRAMTFNSLLMKVLERFPLLEKILNLQ
jgi:hypothetical protein